MNLHRGCLNTQCFVCCIRRRVSPLSSPTRHSPDSIISSSKSFRIDMLEPTTRFPTPSRRRLVMLFNHLHKLILRRRRPPDRFLHNNGFSPPTRSPPRWRRDFSPNLFHHHFTLRHNGCRVPTPWRCSPRRRSWSAGWGPGTPPNDLFLHDR